MKVLLNEDIEKLGWLGDVVDVKDGYARNYLIPYSLAIVPTEENIAALAEEKAKRAEVRKIAKDKLAKVAESVSGAVVSIEAKANEQGHLFGSVTEGDIAKALRDAGFEINASYVVLDHHIKEVGEFDVTIKFAVDLEAVVKVNVIAQGEEVEPTEASN